MIEECFSAEEESSKRLTRTDPLALRQRGRLSWDQLKVF